MGYMTDGVTFNVLRQANVNRQKEWPGNDKADVPFRALEVAGEAGELAEKVAMGRIEQAASRRTRQGAKRRRDWYRSMMDCGDDQCGECRVCRHFEFEDFVNAVALPDLPISVTYDPCVIAYLNASK